MRMQKRQFRIGDLAKHLEVEKFVIRFWEKEFGVSTTRSDGGQRFYSEEDLDTFKRIKTLLYDEGFTIAGAKKQLTNPDATQIVGSTKTIIHAQDIEHDRDTNAHADISAIKQQILSLKQQLIKLHDLL